MEIRALDLADDAVMREAYDVETRSSILGRDGLPHWSLQEFLGALRGPDSEERHEFYGGYDGDRLLGFTLIWFPLSDNTDKCYFDVHVDPSAARRGVGRALVAHVEERARADSRTMVMGGVKVPFADRETHGYRRFAESCGYELANFEVMRLLPLPVDDAQLQAWLDEAALHHEDYEIVTLVDEVPEDLADSLCVLLGQLAVDAPTGEVDFEEETWTPERLVERQETVRAMGRSLYETVALTPDRVVAAQSTLAVPLNGGTDVFQWGTFVHREHRGHRLGLATKAQNLRAVQSAHPGMARVVTGNAETNGYMVSINEEMGFAPTEVEAEYFKRL